MDAGSGGDARGSTEEPGAASAETAPTPGDLQRAWRDEIALVRQLRQQGLSFDHPAMRAACAARDGAERAWREAKEPTPAAVRLSRAQSKLDRAIAIQAEARQALLAYEAEHREKLRGLQSRLDEDTARVRLRRQQLEQIQEEVGTAGTSRASAERGEAVRQAHGALCHDVAPAIALLVEQVDSSSPAWTALNGILGKLAASSALLEKALPAPAAAQTFDIGDRRATGQQVADEEWEGWSDDDDDWSESHELQGHDRAEGRGDAPWGDRADDMAGAGCQRPEDVQDASMGTDDWWDSAPAQWPAGVRWQACGHGKWMRGSWADAWEREHEDEHAAGGAPPAARRRLEAAPTPAAGGATTPRADDGDDDARRRSEYEARVAQIVAKAIDAGVQPIASDGAELHELAPNQLDEWVAANMPSELLK